MDSGNLSCTPFAYRSNAAGGFFPLSGSIVWRNSHEAAIKIPADRRALLFWTLFIGLGAVAGACMMLLDPTGKAMGMDAMLPYFQVLPMASILFQGCMFFVLTQEASAL